MAPDGKTETKSGTSGAAKAGGDFGTGRGSSSGRLSHRLAPYLLLGVLLALAYPGAMTNDAFGWLIRARSGVFSDVQPIMPSLVWRGLETLYPGPMLFVLLNLALVVFSANAVLGRSIRPRWLALLSVAAFFAYPPILTITGVVWRDVTGLGLTLATLAVTISCLEREPGRACVNPVIAIVLLTLVGSLFRYNHAAGVLPFLFIVAWHHIPPAKGRTLRFMAAGVLALLLGAASTVGAMKTTKLLSESQAHSAQARDGYILARISLKRSENLFPEEIYPAMTLARLEERFENTDKPFRRIFWTAFSRGNDPDFPRLDDAKSVAALHLAYRAAIRRHLGVYLLIRIEEALQWLSFSNNYRSGTLRTGFSNLEHFKEYLDIDFPTEKPEWSDWVLRKADAFNRWPATNNPLYALSVGLFALLFSVVRPSRTRRLVVWLLVLSATFHFLGIALNVLTYEFRYGHQSIALSFLAILVLAFGGARHEKEDTGRGQAA